MPRVWTLKKKLSKRLFSLQDGSQPDNFNHPFSNLLEFAELLKCPITGKERSLYSLRHYYATQKLLQGVAIHDLARQMGTSAIMIEKHYSHLRPRQRAETLAGGPGARAGVGQGALVGPATSKASKPKGINAGAVAQA